MVLKCQNLTRDTYGELTVQGIFQRISPHIDSSLHSPKILGALYELG